MVGSWCGRRGSLWFLGAPVTILKLLSSISWEQAVSWGAGDFSGFHKEVSTLLQLKPIMSRDKESTLKTHGECRGDTRAPLGW
jgi:hypothetical protein